VETRSALPAKFDSADPTVIADPYPEYARLRAAGPLCRFGPLQYGVTRYADVEALLRDSRLKKYTMPDAFYRLFTGGGSATEFFTRQDMVYGNPPVRRVFVRQLGPAAVRERSASIAEAADDLVEAALAAGECDIVATLAAPMPVRVLGDLIGVPPADRAEIARHVAALSVFGDAPLTAGGAMTGADEAVDRLRDYFGALLHERIAHPRDDLMSLVGTVDDAAARQQGVDDVITLLYAGIDTTKNLLATAFAAFTRFPAEFARLRADPGLTPTAIDEFLRFDAPIQTTTRIVGEGEHVTVAGRGMRAGRVLVLMLGSANHDEERFARPDRLDIGRRPNPHLTFGGGPYYCLGATLARAEASAVLTTLARRCAEIRPAGVPVRAPQLNFRALVQVPVALVGA
jgi:cytochrome P450